MVSQLVIEKRGLPVVYVEGPDSQLFIEKRRIHSKVISFRSYIQGGFGWLVFRFFCKDF